MNVYDFSVYELKSMLLMEVSQICVKWKITERNAISLKSFAKSLA